jgi:hypothetical protein
LRWKITIGLSQPISSRAESNRFTRIRPRRSLTAL